MGLDTPDHHLPQPHTRASEESGAERRQRVIETTETLVKTMESILEEREASRTKEKEAVESLNAVLQRMGYQIVPLHQDAKRRLKRSRAVDTARPFSEVDTQTDTTPRRRGRPRKTQAEEELVS
jgi:hypothetical protein